MAAFDHATVRVKRMLRVAKERLELACLGVLDVETAYIKASKRERLTKARLIKASKREIKYVSK